MMKETKGNSRLLYVSQTVKELDISSAISEIDSHIHHSSKLQLVGDEIIIDFEKSPRDDDFKASSIKIGREIIGYDSDVFSVLGFLDAPKQTVDLLPIQLRSSWQDLFNEAIDLVEDEKWRLLIRDDFSSASIVRNFSH